MANPTPESRRTMTDKMKTVMNNEVLAWIRMAVLLGGVAFAAGKLASEIQSYKREIQNYSAALQATNLAIQKNTERITKLEISTTAYSARNDSDHQHIIQMLSEARTNLRELIKQINKKDTM